VNDPSRGIAIIQTQRGRKGEHGSPCFNPSRGIAIIQTPFAIRLRSLYRVSIPHAG